MYARTYVECVALKVANRTEHIKIHLFSQRGQQNRMYLNISIENNKRHENLISVFLV